MTHQRRAFTLIELLVVIAIIAILAAILFPVFAQAKQAAKKAAEISNNKQLSLGALQYMADNDDHFMLWAYNDTYNNPLPASMADVDSTFLTQAWPYIKNKQIMTDPMDPASATDRLDADGELINPNAASDPTMRAYIELFNWTVVADWGVNVQYIGPQYLSGSGTDMHSIAQTEIQRPGSTYMALSSLWNRRADGTPYGGGNAGVDPPCVYDTNGNDTRPGYINGDGWYWYDAWNVSNPMAWNVFGGVWPWYLSGKEVIVSYTDGHVKAQNVTSLAAGCNVQDYWGGEIYDKTQYNWATTF